MFEAGAKDALKMLLLSSNDVDREFVADFQIVLKSGQYQLSLRNLGAANVNKLIRVCKCCHS